MSKNIKNIYSDKEYQIPDLTAEDLKEICAVGLDSAAGLDGWSARDLALLSHQAYQLLADLLNCIECGAPWPEAMLETRAVFLSKDFNKTTDPLAYRILNITSGIYRKWGSKRLQQLSKWIARWDHPAINSGVARKGAFDAWLRTAIDIENNSINNMDTAGASIDVFKCFDQINRKLIYKLAKKQVCPLEY